MPPVQAEGSSSAQVPPPVASTPALPVKKRNYGRIIETILLVLMSITAVTFIGLYIWKHMEWSEINTEFNERKDEAKEVARAEQEELGRIYFERRQADPYATFTGPDDYGTLSFRYPKAWNVYVARDAHRGGDFEAYLNPGMIPTVTPTTMYALRVLIRDRTFDAVLREYDGLVTSGKLDMSVISIGGRSANRYDGEFAPGIVGTAVVIKIWDKTAILRTDSIEFRPEFETMLETITYRGE
jgi:hypothetical protein